MTEEKIREKTEEKIKETAKNENKNQSYQKLDEEIEMLPLTFDPVFKGVFERNLEILKRFLIATLELKLDVNKCTIELLNNELLKENMKEYHKTVDIFVLLNSNIYINIEINRESFESVKLRNFIYSDKIFSMFLESGDHPKDLKDIYFYQLNLNTEDKTITYGEDVIVAYGLKTKSVYMDHKYIVLKYLEFYRNLYYTNLESLSESEIWLASLTAKNFTELNEMLSHVLSLQDKNKLIGETIRMSKRIFNVHEWEREKCDELVSFERDRISREEGVKEGLEQGIEQGIEQTILSMLAKNLDKNLIAEITGKSLKEINKIQKENK